MQAAMRVFKYFGLVAACVPIYLALACISRRSAARMARRFHRLSALAIGLQIDIRGQPSDGGPTLLASNHVSYLDIVALGASIEASFVAKSEVAKWPFIGFLAYLQRTEFVQRTGGDVAEQRDRLAHRLSRGDNLILFPEGTSSDGAHVLPFKSPLFDAAVKMGAGTKVQPVSVTYTRLNDIPLGRSLRPNVAWYGDMDLIPHLPRVLSLGRLSVVVEFHRPIEIDGARDRKALAAYCEAAVRSGVARALSGRHENPGFA
ncbi:MAG: 1-acyl-sn-glycerol-3-phosphate acyltransferase [Rhodospirillaceae bacterium]|nr:1-acyl-sn-glycerol-3-phosphate acyltransferase [Rhodospirillaceae bacterium]